MTITSGTIGAMAVLVCQNYQQILDKMLLSANCINMLLSFGVKNMIIDIKGVVLRKAWKSMCQLTFRGFSCNVDSWKGQKVLKRIRNWY